MADEPRVVAMGNLILKLINQILESDMKVLQLEEKLKILQDHIENQEHDGSSTKTKH